jgi:hypothetical protein
MLFFCFILQDCVSYYGADQAPTNQPLSSSSSSSAKIQDNHEDHNNDENDDEEGNTDNAVRQYPPDPSDAASRKSVLKYTAGYIIVTEFCERLAYYGFAGSLVLFFQASSWW